MWTAKNRLIGFTDSACEYSPIPPCPFPTTDTEPSDLAPSNGSSLTRGRGSQVPGPYYNDSPLAAAGIGGALGPGRKGGTP